MPHIPVSWGELIDKITILEIKSARLTGDAALANVVRELALLRAIAEPVLTADAETAGLASRLKNLNEKLWELEDHIRGKDAVGEFDAEFIALARAIHRDNDARSVLKRQISLRLASELIEEKSYAPTTAQLSG